MSSNVNGTKLSLKVMINKQKTKVLFAEANTDFVDVLLSFLTLPLGKVVTILRKNSGEEAAAIGSLNTLYTGLCGLNNYFCVRGAKQMLVNPRSSFGAECRKLALNITDCQPNQYFLCPNYTNHNSVCMYSDIATCEQCGSSLNREIRVAECLDGGAFTIEPFSFIITDDLSVAPIVSGIIQTLSNLGITDTRGAEMKSFSFGVNEIRDLLKFSLTSATPLTDIIINKTHTSSTVANPEHGILFHPNPKEDDKSRKMNLQVCLQKSTNKFLFAEATGEFVELLFSFLTIPLGGVEFLLGGKIGLKNIDNLYRSLSDVIDDKCFITPEYKNRLINPKLPHGYISKCQFLPLCEEARPKLYYEWKLNEQSTRNEYFYYEKSGTLVSSFKVGKENYVKKQTMCFVTDDLTVSPSLTSSISILNGLGIPLSDVRETELHIGLGEALSILKASLT